MFLQTNGRVLYKYYIFLKTNLGIESQVEKQGGIINLIGMDVNIF